MALPLPPSRTSSPAPLPVRADNGPWALHDAATTRAMEQAALAATPEHTLMSRAGQALARLAIARAPQAGRTVVVAGPGNNGGDGLVAARLLHAAGLEVAVWLVGNPAQRPADAAQALAQARAAGVPLLEDRSALQGAGLVIDALQGLGATRAPRDSVAQAIDAVGAQAAPVLAVDLPSGLHADTGVLLGRQAVRAQATLSLLTLKPGLFTGHGRDHAGEVWLDGLGVDASTLPGAQHRPTAWLSGPPPARLRRHSAHKGSHGDVLVVGGAPGMAGAAGLAAGAALTAGAGRVYVHLLDPQAAAGAVPASRPELMQAGAHRLADPAWLAASTVVAGCGGGTEVAAALPPLISHAGRLVLDADALNAVAADIGLLTLLRHRAARGRPTLITPHPLEAARLLACELREVQHDRLAAARRMAAATGATGLLKGSGSVVAAPDGRCRINPTGNAALAGPGTGDVLAGWAAGLWAQRREADALEVAVAAAWQHGRAADVYALQFPGRPLPAADLVQALWALP